MACSPANWMVRKTLSKTSSATTSTKHSVITLRLIIRTCLDQFSFTDLHSKPGLMHCQMEMRAAVKEAVTLQRQLHDQAEIDSAEIIREAGGEIVTLTPQQRQAFIDAVAPIYADAQNQYDRVLLNLVGL